MWPPWNWKIQPSGGDAFILYKTGKVRLSTRPLLNRRLALKPHEKGRDSTGYLWCGAGLSCAASTRLNNLCCCFALSQKEVMENVLRAEGYPTIPHHHPIIYSSIIHPSIATSFFFCYHTLNETSYIYWMLICFFYHHHHQQQPSKINFESMKRSTKDRLCEQQPSPPSVISHKRPPNVCFRSCDGSRLYDVGPVTVSGCSTLPRGGRKKRHPVREVVASPSIPFCSVSRHTSCYFSSRGGRSHSLMWSVEMNSFAALFKRSKWSRSWTQTRHFMRVGFIVGCVGFEIGRPQKVNV